MTGWEPGAPSSDSCVLACGACRRGVEVGREETSFECGCGAVNLIRGCSGCGGAMVVSRAGRRPPAFWSCPWCLHDTMGVSANERYRARPTAADAWNSLDLHGMTGGDPHARVLGGFTMIAGSGDGPPVNSACSIAGLKDGVLVVTESGARRSWLLGYDDLLALDVGGHGLVTTARAYAGGGRGVIGMASGMALASMLSAMSRRTMLDSFLRITSRDSELVLNHSRYTPETVRNSLSMMFVRFQAARQELLFGRAVPEAPAAEGGALDELERLTRLHAAGTLTDMEFEAARARHIRRLTE